MVISKEMGFIAFKKRICVKIHIDCVGFSFVLSRIQERELFGSDIVQFDELQFQCLACVFRIR